MIEAQIAYRGLPGVVVGVIPDQDLGVGQRIRLCGLSREVADVPADQNFIDARGMAAATGVTSNIEDMAKFVQAQFRIGRMGGGQILSSGSFREMHRVRVLENNWTRGYAIGFEVSRGKDKIYISHGGSYPGYTTHTLIQLDSKVGATVMTNASDSSPEDIAKQLMNTVGEAVAKASVPAVTPVQWDPSWPVSQACIPVEAGILRSLS